MRRLQAIALITAFALAGCGSDEEPTEKPAASQRDGASEMSVAQYTAEFDSLRKTVEDARGDYFHSKGGEAAVASVRDAYSGSADALGNIQPPKAAAGFHARVIALWEKRAAQLDKAISSKGFKPSDGSRILQGTSDAEGALYDEIYILPQ